jgi:Resolvase, N terminal domain
VYWHTIAPNYAKLQTIPENRVYLSVGRADEFVRDFVAFSLGKVASDDGRAPGVEIGRPNDFCRRVRIDSTFGTITVLATDGHLPYPYGREITGDLGICATLTGLAIDTTSPAGRLMFQDTGGFAEFERSMIRQRVRAGLKRAVEQGKRLGRPRIGPATEKRIQQLRAGKGMLAVARECGVARVPCSVSRAKWTPFAVSTAQAWP